MHMPLAAVFFACLPVFATAATIGETLSSGDRFSQLVEAAELAGIDAMLSGPGPLTVFAPTDEAFAKVPPERLEGLMQPSSKVELVKLLGLHTIAGRVTAADWEGRTISTRTLTGPPVTIADVEGGLTVNGVRIVESIDADNGVIHVLDAVLLPPTPIAAHTDR